MRIYYLRRLFENFNYLRHAIRAVLPTIPAVGLVLIARAVEQGERTVGTAFGELFAYLAVTVVATWLFEGRLLREAFSYLKARRAPALPEPVPAEPEPQPATIVA